MTVGVLLSTGGAASHPSRARRRRAHRHRGGPGRPRDASVPCPKEGRLMAQARERRVYQQVSEGVPGHVSRRRYY